MFFAGVNLSKNLGCAHLVYFYRQGLSDMFCPVQEASEASLTSKGEEFYSQEIK